MWWIIRIKCLFYLTRAPILAIAAKMGDRSKSGRGNSISLKYLASSSYLMLVIFCPKKVYLLYAHHPYREIERVFCLVCYGFVTGGCDLVFLCPWRLWCFFVTVACFLCTTVLKWAFCGVFTTLDSEAHASWVNAARIKKTNAYLASFFISYLLLVVSHTWVKLSCCCRARALPSLGLTVKFDNFKNIMFQVSEAINPG